MMNESEQAAAVAAAFQQAGLKPGESELDSFVAAYPAVRSFLDSLYALPGVRYESPALTFDPRKAYRDE